VAAEQKRIKVTPRTNLNRVLDQARTSPVVLERDGEMYEVNALNEDLPEYDRSFSTSLAPSPYTLETVYGSLLPSSGRTYISDHDIEKRIEVGKKENLRSIVEGMQGSA
jgi:hypothetical protein